MQAVNINLARRISDYFGINRPYHDCPDRRQANAPSSSWMRGTEYVPAGGSGLVLLALGMPVQEQSHLAVQCDCLK